MCQSISDGGRRCAAHTRPLYESSLQRFLDKRESQRTTGDYHDMFSTAKAFASTKKGFSEVESDAKKYEDTRDKDLKSILADALIYGAIVLKQHKEVDNAVKVETTTQIEKTLADALTTVRAAIALGFPAPSFVGGKYYSVYVSINNYSYDADEVNHPLFLGDYPDKELAEKALVSYIKENMGTDFPTGRQILGPDGEVYWVALGENRWVAGEKASNEEVIRSYFASGSKDGFLVQEKELLGELKPEIKYGERSSPTVLERDFTYIR